MAVAVSTAAVATFSGTDGSKTLTAPSGSNRVVLIMYGSSKTTDVAPPEITGSVTYGGQTATLLTSYTFELDGAHQRNKVSIFYVLEAGIAAASGTTVAATFASSVDYGRFGAWGLNGAYQGAPAHYTNESGDNDLGPMSNQLFDTETGAKILAMSILIGELNQPVAINNVLFDTVDASTTGGLIQNVLKSGPSSEGASTFGHGWARASDGTTPEQVSWFLPTVEINTSDWSPPAAAFTQSFCPYVSRGQIREMVTNVTGLDHLEGEQVKVQVDGVVDESQTYTVSGGTLDNALPNKAAVIHVGLGYTGKIKLLKASSGNPAGTGQMKARRISLAGLRVYRSLNFKVGITEADLVPVILGDPVLPLLTKDLLKVHRATWGKEQQFFIVQDKALPLFLLCVILESEVETAG